MDITLIINGDLVNGYETARPIILEARIVLEDKSEFWLVTDEVFHRYGAHEEFRLAVADCLEDMAAYFEAVSGGAPDTADAALAEDMARYLRKSPRYEFFRGADGQANETPAPIQEL